MNIVSTTLFELETKLPYIDNIGGATELYSSYTDKYNAYIEEHEPYYYRYMFGVKFQKELYDYVNNPPPTPDEEIDAIIEETKLLARDYIFCKIMESEDTKYSLDNSSKGISENSASLSSKDRYVLVWNRMARRNREVLCSLDREFVKQHNISICESHKAATFTNTLGI